MIICKILSYLYLSLIVFLLILIITKPIWSKKIDKINSTETGRKIYKGLYTFLTYLQIFP